MDTCTGDGKTCFFLERIKVMNLEGDINVMFVW